MYENFEIAQRIMIETQAVQIIIFFLKSNYQFYVIEYMDMNICCEWMWIGYKKIIVFENDEKWTIDKKLWYSRINMQHLSYIIF